MKKAIIVLSLIVMGTASVFAGPRGCPGGGGGCHPCRPCRPCPRPPRPCYGWGYGRGCNRDLANAAAITSIVASGVSILSDLVRPQYAVVQQPVVVPQQQVVAPVPSVYAPAAQYYAPAASTGIYR